MKNKILEHIRFIQKKPKIIPRIIKNYIYVRILKKNRLRTIDWAMTYKCNLDCKMCSAKKLIEHNKNKKELTPKQIQKTWKQATKLGAIHINLTGGEPTLRNEKEIIQIIKNINKERALISMVTNCTIINKQKLKKYKEAGLDTLQVSIESLEENIHDELRRMKGNCKKVLQTVEWAKELKLNVCLSTVLTKNNFESTKELIKYAKKKEIIVLLNPISASGRKSGQFDESIKEMKEEYYKLLENKNVRADTVLNFRGGSGCPAGVERIHITPIGDVITCPHVQVSYGNITKEPLEKIYKRISEFPYLKEFKKDCRHIWDKEYIEKIMKPTFTTEKIPIPIWKHPITKETKIKEYLRKR